MGQMDGKVAIVTGSGRGIGREFALSGSEQNPDLTNRNLLEFFKRVVLGVPLNGQRKARRGVEIPIRRLAGLDALDEAIEIILVGVPRVGVDVVHLGLLAHDFVENLHFGHIGVVRSGGMLGQARRRCVRRPGDSDEGEPAVRRGAPEHV